MKTINHRIDTNQLELPQREPSRYDLPVGANDKWAQKFDEWRQTPGGKRVLQMGYAIAARYASRYRRTGRRVSINLIWSLLRDNVVAVASKRRALQLEKVDGFALNDNFQAYAARHMMAHRPEWDGLFETRELGRRKLVERTTVVRERFAEGGGR